MSVQAKSTMKRRDGNFSKNLGSKPRWKESQNCQRQSAPVMNSFVSTAGPTMERFDRTRVRSTQADFFRQQSSTDGSKHARKNSRPDLLSAGKSGGRKILNACVDGVMSILNPACRRGPLPSA